MSPSLVFGEGCFGWVDFNLVIILRYFMRLSLTTHTIAYPHLPPPHTHTQTNVIRRRIRTPCALSQSHATRDIFRRRPGRAHGDDKLLFIIDLWGFCGVLRRQTSKGFKHAASGHTRGELAFCVKVVINPRVNLCRWNTLTIPSNDENLFGFFPLSVVCLWHAWPVILRVRLIDIVSR